MQSMADYDIALVGGGMVGAALAIALAGRGLRIAVIESAPWRAEREPSYDDRVIALAYGTRRIFKAMGLWDELALHATPIRQIHVSDRGRFGTARLRAQSESVDALGYVVESRALGKVLGPRLEALEGVDLHRPATLRGLSVDAQGAWLDLDGPRAPARLRARLVIAADGTASVVRRQLGIRITEWGYGQTALITNITPSQPHANIAYERFTDTGPLAFLPMSEGRCSVVWTVADADADRIMSLGTDEFVLELQRRFGQRLGRLTRVGARVAYPLRMTRAREHVRPRVALIGNAAHTLHPVAGQGYNLGLRDVAVMAQVLIEAHAAGEDLGCERVLRRYERWRTRDHLRAIGLTDGLARIFTNPLPPVAAARDAGLVMLDLFSPLKRALAKQTMGLAGRLPRLARGLPL